MNRLYRAALAALALGLVAVIALCQVLGLPTGANVQNPVTSSAGNGSPSNRTDARSTITTMTLDALQQDQYWKGYVGNVTGKLTLDDANSFTIYDWSLTGATITGEVYASRNSSPVFTNVSCANDSVVGAEETYNNMTATQVDNINRTFASMLHTIVRVGENAIANSTCQSLFTYINDTNQTAGEAAYFQEVLLQDIAGNIIYVTNIENNHQGYNNNQFDFQLIVAESDRKSTPTTYYFFTEVATG